MSQQQAAEILKAYNQQQGGPAPPGAGGASPLPSGPGYVPSAGPAAGVFVANEAATAAAAAAGQPSSPERGMGTGPFGVGKLPTLVHEPGGDVLRELLHPAFVPFERLFRVLPEDAWFDPSVSPRRPISFELGSFEVPDNQHLWMYDYEFAVYRLSGMDPGDIVRLEEYRLSAVLGFDVTFSGRRPDNIAYELDPVPVSVTRGAFDQGGSAPAAGAFNKAAANSFAATASPGTALLPVRTRRMGARQTPFTLVARTRDRVALSCVIFRPVPLPVAAIEGIMAGFLVHTQMSQELIHRMAPK
jgi:hypothetical protein